MNQHNTGLSMDASERPDPNTALDRLGQVIVSFPAQADMPGALAALLTAGFTNEDVVAYSAGQMARQARLDIANAGMLAAIGQDLNLMKADLQNAEQGCSFLVVRAATHDQTAAVLGIARRFNASRAQKYGLLLIEELLASGSGEPQVFESGDRGLDERGTGTEREGAAR